MGDMVLLTVTGKAGLEPSLSELAEQLNVPVHAFDQKFGLIALRVDRSAFAVRIDSAFLPNELPAEIQIEGPYSDPKIAPFGPPEAEDN